MKIHNRNMVSDIDYTLSDTMEIKHKNKNGIIWVLYKRNNKMIEVNELELAKQLIDKYWETGKTGYEELANKDLFIRGIGGKEKIIYL